MSNLLLGPLHGVLAPNTDLARRVGVGLELRIQGVALRQRERVRALAEACVFALLWRRCGVVVAPARADDDLVRRRLGSRHAADGFDDGLRYLLPYYMIAAGLRQPGDPVCESVSREHGC